MSPQTVSAQRTLNALVVETPGEAGRIIQLPFAALPEGNVLVRVCYSSLNYKDALAVTGKGKVVREFPMVPGVDIAGIVVRSDSPAFIEGEEVFSTGWDSGERRFGGFAEYASLNAQQILKVPDGLSLWDTMALGTAGLTAMLSIMAMERNGLRPKNGPVLVTGASGGVGSYSVKLLAKCGYSVFAATGKPHAHEYLRSLGAQEILGREAIFAESGKALMSEEWAGAIDTVGSETLASILSRMKHSGCVVSCGLAGGSDLKTTVFPFILRGICLLGIDTARCPMNVRRKAWARIQNLLSREDIMCIAGETITLDKVIERADELLAGCVIGRVVVAVTA